MKGLKIVINDDDAINIASDRVVSIFFNIGKQREDNWIHIGGLDSKSYHLTWLDQELVEGDRIKVKICDIDEVATLKERTPSDRSELVNRYRMLKEELKEQGLV